MQLGGKGSLYESLSIGLAVQVKTPARLGRASFLSPFFCGN